MELVVEIIDSQYYILLLYLGDKNFLEVSKLFSILKIL